MASGISLYGRVRHFLRKFIVHGRVRTMLQWIFAKFQALFIQPTILPYFISFFPYKKTAYAYRIPKLPVPDAKTEAELPHPPETLWLGYGKTIEEYLGSGQEHVGTMRRIMSEAGENFEQGGRILEFGCAAARMMRFLHDLTDKYEIWGTDISAEHIVWCKQHLTPPFNFFTTTQHPHLPFEDGYFDFIYAKSVFTHIDDMTDAWLLELRRILRPGGKFYFTVHDNDTIRVLNEKPDNLTRTLHCRRDFYEKGGFAMFTIGRFMRSQVFYDTEYLTRSLQQIFDVVSVTPEAAGFQTAVVVSKR